MQGTQVQSLIWEDPTCHWATKPLCHSYGACMPRAHALRQEKPLFNGWVIFHGVYVPQLLIHSSADGHLGCFHVLATINSAAMNIGVHMSLSDLVSCLPPHPIPLGLPSAPVRSTCLMLQPGLVICFTLDSILVSMLFSQNIPPSPSPRVPKSVLYICVSFSVLHIGLSLPSF